MLASTYPGCGAWKTTADVFAVFINGVDYSDAAHNVAGASITIDGLSISTSIESNATASFRIDDPARGVSILPFSDVVIWYKPPGGTERILFSGLVIGRATSQVGVGRRLDMRCVDYGFLLDRARSRTIRVLRSCSSAEAIQAVPLPSPLVALAPAGDYVSGDGRVQKSRPIGVDLKYLSDEIPYSTYTDEFSGSPRGLLGDVASRVVRWVGYTPGYPTYVYVDPLRRLNAWGETNETAPATLTDAPAGPNPESLSVGEEYTGLENGVYIWDLSVAAAPKPLYPPLDPNSTGMYTGDRASANGYLLAPNSISRNIGPGGWEIENYAPGYLAQHGFATRGTFSLTTTDDWHIGQVVTITSAAHDLSSVPFLITSVSWAFASGGMGRISIGISRTGASSTPTRLARAGESGMRSNRAYLTRAGA